MSEENGNKTTPDKSNVPLVTYKYGDQEVSLNLSDPEQLKTASDLLAKGRNMEKIAEERNKLREDNERLQEMVDKWNDTLEAAKDDDEALGELQEKIEGYIGRPMTKTEKSDLRVQLDDTDDSDPVTRMNKRLESFIAEQEKKEKLREKATKEEELRKDAQEMVANLDRMAKDTEHYPNFDKDAVYKKARDAGTTDFEMVYYYLNRENMIKAEREKIEKEYKDLIDKRKLAHTESDASSVTHKEPAKVYGKIEAVTKDVLEELRKGDVSLFKD
jgi:hypothetical protein